MSEFCSDCALHWCHFGVRLIDSSEFKVPCSAISLHSPPATLNSLKMPSMKSFLIQPIALFLTSVAIVSAFNIQPDAQTDPALEHPDCYACKDTDNCYVDEKRGFNMTKVDGSNWSSKVTKGQYPYLTIFFGTPSGQVTGLQPYMKMANNFDLDAIVAFHYIHQGAVKTAFYKAFGNQECKSSIPAGSSPQGINRINYEYPDLRN